jgi:hypothetical protein
MPRTEKLPDGGTVTFRTMAELPPRQRRRIKPYVLALSGRLEQMSQAATITVDGKVAASSAKLTGPALTMSLDEAELFTDMQDQTTLAVLAAWSLPFPLPSTLDELLDVDDTTGRVGLYDFLSEQAAKVTADAISAAGFTVDSVEDPASPTGAFGD